jgi:hypothetical protein
VHVCAGFNPHRDQPVGGYKTSTCRGFLDGYPDRIAIQRGKPYVTRACEQNVGTKGSHSDPKR